MSLVGVSGRQKDMHKDHTEGNRVRVQDGTLSSESEYAAKVFLLARTPEFCWEILPLPEFLDTVQDYEMAISQSYATWDQGRDEAVSW
jgi:hypothetical protein